MQIMSDALLINQKNYPGSVIKLSQISMHRKIILIHFGQFYRNINVKTLNNWIINHDHVKESYCSNNCTKIKVDGGDERSLSENYIYRCL